MASVGFFNTDKDRYAPSGGREVKEDGTILDVAAWRESTEQELVDINTELDAQTALLQEIAGDTGGDASTATITQPVLNSTTSTKIKDSGSDFVGFAVSNESTIDIWIKFQPASDDNDKKGIFLERGGFYEMPTGQRYTGEISAISDSGTPTINVVFY